MASRHRRILLNASDDEVDDLSFLSRPAPPPTVAMSRPPPEPSPVRLSVLSASTDVGVAESEAGDELADPSTHQSSTATLSTSAVSASGGAIPPVDARRCEDSLFPTVSVLCDGVAVAAANQFGIPALLPPVEEIELERLDQLRLALDRISRELRKAILRAANSQGAGSGDAELTEDDDGRRDDGHVLGEEESEEEESTSISSSSDSSDAGWRRRARKKTAAKSGKKERAGKPKALAPTVSELKRQLKLHGLSVSGRKSQLLFRLAAASSATPAAGACLDHPIVLVDEEDGGESATPRAATSIPNVTISEDRSVQPGEQSATVGALVDPIAESQTAAADVPEASATVTRRSTATTPDLHGEMGSHISEKESGGSRSSFASALLERIGFVTPRRLFGWFDPSQH